ncbi:L-seryl-tRNA(Sec) selenium transferase [Spongiactinospora gelatinilytica]|uniref:L-seryl-tRNA(Sec) selenium transferase n=1 Tax=Spongiactinospora gelatinilytica TaxID=2666298 RepID=A0A2W2G1P4_9ACTN|nr:L-seryl-tRNA(Sec) selenium transferase [Spongiactinospora gelatinilytica]PZG41873.1 L-seryl-tRNA(Sec) selenium transferase [Spongiactinospora gelatinilytica]
MDHRRRIPRTDAVLADPRMRAVLSALGRAQVKAAVAAAQERARAGEIAPADVVESALTALAPAAPLRPVINATGVLLHTNLGRAPLAEAAIEAVAAAAGPADVEFDLVTGRRARRGRSALAALAAAVPEAGDVHLVNNNAAALVLAATALAADGGEIVISRGELVEIGDGFRIPELLTATGATLREVGTTNRTTPADYAAAVGPRTGFVLKVHPSNFRVEGFTGAAGIAQLTGLGVPVVADVGSGLLEPEPVLPDEPSVRGALREGADLVTASGDKLAGGPQAGLLLGRAHLVERLRRHPLARALRVDKLTLAALEATLHAPETPVRRALLATAGALRERATAIAAQLSHLDITVEDVAATVGGGGAPGVRLPSAAVSLPARFATPLRTGEPPVVGRVEDGRLLLDLRAVPEGRDADLVKAITAAVR